MQKLFKFVLTFLKAANAITVELSVSLSGS